MANAPPDMWGASAVVMKGMQEMTDLSYIYSPRGGQHDADDMRLGRSICSPRYEATVQASSVHLSIDGARELAHAPRRLIESLMCDERPKGVILPPSPS